MGEKRGQFEKWFGEKIARHYKHLPQPLVKTPSGDYLNPSVQDLWEGWQGRDALGAPDSRNIEAELLTELLKVLGEELGCGQNAYEIRQKIAELKCQNESSINHSQRAPIAEESITERRETSAPTFARSAAEILGPTQKADAPVNRAQGEAPAQAAQEFVEGEEK